MGSQLIGIVAIPMEQTYSGEQVEGTYPMLNNNGKPCKQGAKLSLSIHYIPMEQYPGMELAKLCVGENVPVVPIPGPCALVSALSASGLSIDEFTFVGFLPKTFGIKKKKAHGFDGANNNTNI
ncbi:hypothetical protein KIW84_070908 [Lathyrus oleraceus]|uniref:Uncharacterized protein n=1 Tax=Pisum sativum TaxID=3888 RepID=A0A9D4VJC0_PEA|nr:hypothetical protein KIW84_070908 [Pisum sativum]